MLHEEVIHAEEAKTAAEHTATTKSLEADELAQVSGWVLF